jgi:hypothetical protein
MDLFDGEYKMRPGGRAQQKRRPTTLDCALASAASRLREN